MHLQAIRLLVIFSFSVYATSEAVSAPCVQLLRENPELLIGNEAPISKEVAFQRLPAIIQHQNTLRSAAKLRPLDSRVESWLALKKFGPGIVRVPNLEKTQVTSIESRGGFSIIREFDDGHFLNTAYEFKDNGKKSVLISVKPLAEFAISRIPTKDVELFRYMGAREFGLWTNKNVTELRAYKPKGGEGTWGYSELNTHVSVFEPWKHGVPEGQNFCGKWTVPREKLLQWAQINKLSFGLTADFSREYELSILSSVWDEFANYSFSPCP